MGRGHSTGIRAMALLLFSRRVVSESLQTHTLQPTRLLCPWDFPVKNTGVGCHALLQGNLPDPGIELASLMSAASAGRFFTTSAT